jgi:hypothetical protein
MEPPPFGPDASSRFRKATTAYSDDLPSSTGTYVEATSDIADSPKNSDKKSSVEFSIRTIAVEIPLPDTKEGAGGNAGPIVPTGMDRLWGTGPGVSPDGGLICNNVKSGPADPVLLVEAALAGMPAIANNKQHAEKNVRNTVTGFGIQLI